jgi:hypothetical protein
MPGEKNWEVSYNYVIVSHKKASGRRENEYLSNEYYTWSG